MSQVAGGFADYFDGETAERQRVRLSYDDGEYGNVLQIELPDGEHMILWAAHRVYTLPDQASYDVMVLTMNDRSPARLVVKDRNAATLVAQVCPNAATPLKEKSRFGRAVLTMVICVALVFGVFKVLLPVTADALASVVDAKTEVAMGEATYAQILTAFSAVPGRPMAQCNSPEGLAAYEKLLKRVMGDLTLPYPIKATVFDDSANPISNAFALPGGRVVFFASMLELAETPEEIAAVMAHEIGHVYHRHGVSNTFQAYAAFAISALLFADGGVAAIGLATQYITSGYSRGAEIESDDFAREQLLSVGLPPAALASLFDKLRAQAGDVEGLDAHFSSHPQLAERIAAARDIPAPSGAPVLSAVEWAALRNICNSTDATNSSLPVAAISR